ncbi:class A beta-lactamase [Streptomyces sp. WAC 00631]|uniref:class A beta-lactamase n=1 Tax=Streptomyces sp. WAC 00631 TaxID=2203201 RepID=UPI000F797BEC|nr:class A beta-lactamase [Streptomyces sp. WAC 00631]MCC5033826.1 class A beta-lactamase [Streptomyces sp. WAC 00631]
MNTAHGTRPARRALFVLGAGAALAACVPSGGAASAASAAGPESPASPTASPPPSGRAREASRRLRALESEHGARLGVFARNLDTGETVVRRADERFPMCSLFKPVAAAAILRDHDRRGEFLARRIRYGTTDLVEHSPITGKHVAQGMTVGELCDAAIRYSDNTAANLLLRELGGPRAVTRFCRSVGDRTTRLDRWETELNSAEPWRVEDTTSPRAIARTYTRLIVGDTLSSADRERLTGWMLANTTSGERFRAGLPADWDLADKTGGGAYGTNNNAGVAWTPDRAPIVLAVLTTKPAPDAAPDNELIAETAELLASALG